MSLITLFTKSAPTLAGVEFDAVLEDTLSLSVKYTEYPIEAGATVRDHGIVQPFQWRLTGAVSNNPIRPTVASIGAGALSNFTNSGVLAGLAGLSAGLLSGGSETRSSNALEFLIALTTGRESFDVDAGDIVLKNMVIANISRTKDASNEDGLIFVADLTELSTLERVLARNAIPKTSELLDGDPSKTQSVGGISSGQVQPLNISPSIANTVSGLL